MWYLVKDNMVVGFSESKKVYGDILNFVRKETNAQPVMVGDFDAVAAPEGVYMTRKDNIYTVRKYAVNEGFLYNVSYYEEFKIYVSHFDNTEKSKLKPSYMDALRERHLLKPVLTKV